MDERAYLLEWAYHFFKSRDSVHRKFSEIQQEKDCLHLVYKDGSETYVFGENTISEMLKRSKGVAAVGVFFNTEELVSELHERWDSLIEDTRLTLYFINPLSKNESYWVIRPAVHARIADPSSLKQGLKSMSSNVDPLTPRQIKTLIKSRDSSSD